MKICIDPGHNSTGADTGAQGNSLKEQDLTLDIALRLKVLLEDRDFEVVMTRTGPSTGRNDTVINSLQYRVDIANQAKADLFVSIHINSGGGTGAEVYALTAGGGGEKCAKAILPFLAAAGGWPNRGAKFADYYVLKWTNMPAVLTENGFIDNASDAEKLAKTEYKQAIAEAHAKGICEYFGIAEAVQTIAQAVQPAVMLENIVLYDDGDQAAAQLLSYRLRCPMMLKEFAGNVQAKKRHWLGVSGTNGNGDYYYAGSDRIETAKKVLGED